MEPINHAECFGHFTCTSRIYTLICIDNIQILKRPTFIGPRHQNSGDIFIEPALKLIEETHIAYLGQTVHKDYVRLIRLANENKLNSRPAKMPASFLTARYRRLKCIYNLAQFNLQPNMPRVYKLIAQLINPTKCRLICVRDPSPKCKPTFSCGKLSGKLENAARM